MFGIKSNFFKEGVVGKVVDKAENWAKSGMNSQFGQTVAFKPRTLMNSVADRHLADVGEKLKTHDEVREALMAHKNGGDLNEGQQKIINSFKDDAGLKDKGVDEWITHNDKGQEQLKAKQDALNNAKNNMSSSTRWGGLDNMMAENGLGIGETLGGMVKDYYGAADKGGNKLTKLARAGTTAAVVGGVAVGARYASGGDLTHDGSGRSNIVGIPFV